ncbi:MAG: dockerin type I repeat-containing protein [Candidatus Zixiibacteriota bacterium]
MLRVKTILAFFLLGLLALPAVAEVQLEVGLDDIGVEPGTPSVVVPLNLINTVDTISSFMFFIQLNRPDIISLDQILDTTNTLISGWEYIEFFNVEGWPTNLFIRAIADLPAPPTTPGISPQTGETPLINIHASISELDDTLPDQTVNLMFQENGIFHSLLVNNHGETLGVRLDTLYDTSYFVCAVWVEDICLYWQEVSLPPYDSIYVDTVPYYVPDPEVYTIVDGSVTVMLSLCGDVNGDNDIDISDITFLISYLYLDGDPPPVLRTANVNNSPDGEIDISDITCLIQFLYIDHRYLICPFIPPHG